VVRGLQGAFAENWLEATGDALVGDDYLPPLDEIPGGWPMQLVRSRSGVGDTNVEALMFLAIESAQETLDLTSAYFVPRPAFINALCEAAQRGVTVRVLVPGTHMDKELVRLAGRRTYEELLSCGVHVFEYCPTMLHAKTLVIDGAWTSVGSVNFDNRSFQQNDEATLCVQSEAFARELTDQFMRDLEVSEEITPQAVGPPADAAPRRRARRRARPARALGAAEAEAHAVLVLVDAQPEDVRQGELDGAVLAVHLVPAVAAEGAVEPAELLLGDAEGEGRGGLEADGDALGHVEPQWWAGWTISVSTPPVLRGCRNATREPRMPARGVRSMRRTPAAASRSSSASMSGVP
jgi:hypothetical protein